MRDTTAPSVYGCVEDSQCLKPTASVCHRRKQNTSEFFPSSIRFMYDMQRKGRGKLSLCAILLRPLSSPLLKPHFPWGATPLLSSRLSTPGVRPLLTFCIWPAVAHVFCFSVCRWSLNLRVQSKVSFLVLSRVLSTERAYSGTQF